RRGALNGRRRYAGAIGSKKTHRERVARLAAAGVSPADLERVHAPIGLDLGAQTAEETALAILSQMVAVRHGKVGGPMPGLAAAAPSAARRPKRFADWLSTQRRLTAPCWHEPCFVRLNVTG